MSQASIIEIKNLTKRYQGGFQALNDVNLSINNQEIFALLGPNGAGKTTMISILCSLTNPSSGQVTVGDFDLFKQAKQARRLIGLVPQELTTAMFETVWATVSFSRGVFNMPPNPKLIERILKQLTLWDKKDNMLMTLSGGMKRRVMIAKALAHEPKILFLDEPTAGVDVELRKDMWALVHDLRESGVTIILTTHYIEEAENMADRIGVINKGKVILVEEKDALMKKLGKKFMKLELTSPLSEIPESLSQFDLSLEDNMLRYNYDTNDNYISEFFQALNKAGICYKDLNTKQSSLEDIFVELIKQS